MWIELHFLACGYLVDPTSFVKKTVFPSTELPLHFVMPESKKMLKKKKLTIWWFAKGVYGSQPRALDALSGQSGERLSNKINEVGLNYNAIYIRIHESMLI